MQISATDSIKFLSIDEDKIQNMIEKSPANIRIEIGADVYGTKEPCITIGNMTMVIINKDVSDDVVYEITKAIWENIDDIKASAPQAKNMKIEEAATGFGIPIHPGAERYYKEMGVIK